MIYVGIVSRVLKDKDGFNITGIGEYYRKALLKYPNVMPILILPPKDIVYGDTSYLEEQQIKPEDNEKLDELLDLCDTFIIPGGTNWFSYDEYIFEYALKNDKPLLGICLGMQIMATIDNRKKGYTSFKPEMLENTNHQQPGVEYVHKINIKENSKLFDILEERECQVNSRHNYHVTKVSDFNISAYSEDGIIEAIEYPNKRFIIGVQWHPELMINYDDIMLKLFDRFIDEAKKNEKIGVYL